MKHMNWFGGFSAISQLLDAYRALLPDVNDPEALGVSAIELLGRIYDLKVMKSGDDREEAGHTIGSAAISLAGAEALFTPIKEKYPAFMRGERIIVPVSVNYTGTWAVTLTQDTTEVQVSKLTQHLLVNKLKAEPNASFRLIDLKSGGQLFSYAHSLVSAFPLKSSGKMLTTHSELNALLDELERVSLDAQAKLGGAYESFEDYNEANETKISRYVIVIQTDSKIGEECVERIHRLRMNAAKNGICWIFVGTEDEIQKLKAEPNLAFSSENGILKLYDLIFEPDQAVFETEKKCNELISEVKAATKVETKMSMHPDFLEKPQSLNSSSCIRIPFALDEYNTVQYFEIGGTAPAHALVSGSTGSGKSVALHTLILEMVHNYHPDDVEIWAVDYKQVEFAPYIQHHSPHFRVIGHDTSVEFSLSLLDLLNEESTRRTNLFLQAGVKDLEDYRRLYGPHSLPRIVVFIDEFQIMTQAVQQVEHIRYKTILENLLKITRALGISFVFCSQTIASGLSGLSDSAREQIGARLCLKHESSSEVREALAITGEDVNEALTVTKNLQRGQALYKKSIKDTDADGKSYSLTKLNILYFDENLRDQVITRATEVVGDQYSKKKTIFVRGGGRISVSERERHPLQTFVHECEYDEDDFYLYPAAPASLADSYRIELEPEEGANVLLVSANDEAKNSILVHSVLGFLVNPYTQVVVNFVEKDGAASKSLIRELEKISCRRLKICAGLDEVLETIESLRRIKPVANGQKVYFWLGLEKLKGALVLKEQEEDDPDDASETAASAYEEQEKSLDAIMGDLSAFLDTLESGTPQKKTANVSNKLNTEASREILSRVFEVGPEYGIFNFAVFSKYKGLKNSKVIDLSCFEHRLLTKMSADDAYSLIGGSGSMITADENSAFYYSGSGKPVRLHPYLMPEADWYEEFNQALQEMEQEL